MRRQYLNELALVLLGVVTKSKVAIKKEQTTAPFLLLDNDFVMAISCWLDLG